MARAPIPLPLLPNVETIQRRLNLVFPDGTPNRANATGERAARTAFVMLYVGAVEGADRWIRPDQVTRMSNEQAARTSAAERIGWSISSLRRQAEAVNRWYSVNSREGIRDDTLRYAWQPLGAVVEKQGLATTSSTPRWALERELAALLTSGVTDTSDNQTLVAWERKRDYRQRITLWQGQHLSAESRARVQIIRRLGGADHSVAVKLPDGNTRMLSPGESSLVAKGVIEEFARLFMIQPAVIWLSESREHVSVRDDQLARSIGLRLSDSRILPDIVLLDLNPARTSLVFCEVVATDGPMNELRRQEIMRLVDQAGFNVRNVLFMTAFTDRTAPAYKRLLPLLAWSSCSWTASEPDKLTIHLDGSQTSAKIPEILDLLHVRPSRRK